MKILVVLTAAAIFAGCVTPKIPDNIPPAPPALKGEPIRAPSAAADAPADDGFGGGDGFGGDGFGGETPAVEATPDAAVAASPEKEDKKEEAKDAKKDPKAPEGATPADGDAPQGDDDGGDAPE